MDKTVNEIVPYVIGELAQLMSLQQPLNIDLVKPLYLIRPLLENDPLNDENKAMIHQMILIMQEKFIEEISSDVLYLHFWTILNLLHTPDSIELAYENHFYILARIKNVRSFIRYKDIIMEAFPVEEFHNYITALEKELFNEEFWSVDTEERKRRVYIYFYINSLIYPRNDDYKLMYEVLKSVFDEAILKDDSELVLFLYGTLLYTWNGVSSTQTAFKVFNDNVERALESFIKKSMMPKYGLEPVKRGVNKEIIHVAFMQDRMIEYSIHTVFKNLLKVLKRHPNSRYKFTVYNLNYAELGGSEERSTQKIARYNVDYLDCHKEFGPNTTEPIYDLTQKVLNIRKDMITREIDVLIGMGGRPEFNMLFSTRTAPIQLYWSHGNYQYALDEVDHLIKHGFIGDKFEIHNERKFLQFPDYTSKESLNPKIGRKEISEEKERFPKDKIVLGTIGRLIKLESDEYLQSVIDVMKRHENTIYLACGHGKPQAIIPKLKENGIEDRWYFTDQINSHIYGHLIDIWPNTFPYNQGLSTLEVVAKGVLNIQMITHQFSKTDGEICELEQRFQELDCSMEAILNEKRTASMVEAYLQKNFFSKEDSQNSAFIKPILLYMPTNSLQSYQAKLEYAVANFEEIKDDVVSFSQIMAKARWMNDQECAKRFYEILDEVSNESK